MCLRIKSQGDKTPFELYLGGVDGSDDPDEG